MKKIIFISFVLFITLTGFSSLLAQQSGIQVNDKYRLLGNANIENDTSIQGSQYLNKEFVLARITSDDGEKIYSIRYNAYLDVIELQDENHKIFSINKSIENLIITVINTEEAFELIEFQEKDSGVKKGYLTHVTPIANTVKLFKRKKIKLTDAKPATNAYDKPKPASYNKIPDQYYIKIGENIAVLASKKKKDILKLFPENSGVISDYIKSNKIKVSKEEGLLKLINFINTL